MNVKGYKNKAPPLLGEAGRGLAICLVFLRLLANVSENTAVDVKNVTVYKVGSVGSEEYGGTCKILGATPFACRGF